VLIDGGAFVPEIVGADDRRVAAGIAAAEPALLDDRDIGDAVLAGEIIRSREAVAAAADYDDVVARLRLGRALLLLPMRMAGQRVPGKGEEGKALHGSAGAGRTLAITTAQGSSRRCVVTAPEPKKVPDRSGTFLR